MQPITVTPLTAPADTDHLLSHHLGIDTIQGIDKDDFLYGGVEPGSFGPVNPLITLAGLPTWRVRSRIEELISADRRKDEFLALLSHELHSPLASIQHAVSVLRSRPGESTELRSMY